MLNVKYLMITSLIIFSTSAYSESHTKNQLDEKAVLEKINYFSLGMNGFVGKENDGERLYKSVLKNSDAKDIFLSIAQNEKSTPEAKLYAVCGLRKLSYGSMDDLFLKYKYKKVTTLKGDILRGVNFNEVYTSILKHGCE